MAARARGHVRGGGSVADVVVAGDGGSVNVVDATQGRVSTGRVVGHVNHVALKRFKNLKTRVEKQASSAWAAGRGR